MMAHRSLLLLVLCLQIAWVLGCTRAPGDDLFAPESEVPATAPPGDPEVPEDPEDPDDPEGDGRRESDTRPGYSAWESEADARSGHWFHLDPEHGSLANPGTAESPWPGLEAVYEAGFIQRWTSAEKPYPEGGVDTLVCENPDAPIEPGDTLVLHGGDHGEVRMHDLHNEEFLAIVAADGEEPVLQQLCLEAIERLLVDGLTIRNARDHDDPDPILGKRLMSITAHGWHGPGRWILVRGCQIESAEDARAWNAPEWLEHARDGIVVRIDDVALHDNVIRNVYFGINAISDRLSIVGNSVAHFGADGIQAMGTDQEISYNAISDSYDIDDNHDDAIQLYPFRDGDRCERIVVRGNTIVSKTELDRALASRLKGIAATYERYFDCTIENNLIVTDAWMGILFRGAENVQIINNTLVDVDPTNDLGTPGIMLRTNEQGEGNEVMLVRNNIANVIESEGHGATIDHNVTVYDPAEVFEAPDAGDYRPRAGGPAHEAGSLLEAPTLDLDRSPRPQGAAIDIGALER